MSVKSYDEPGCRAWDYYLSLPRMETEPPGQKPGERGGGIPVEAPRHPASSIGGRNGIDSLSSESRTITAQVQSPKLFKDEGSTPSASTITTQL